MQGLLKTLGRSYSARYVEGAGYRRRFGSMALGRLVSAALLFTSSALFGAMTTIDVCPLVAKSTLVSQMETSKTISVVLALPSADPAGLKAFVDHVSNEFPYLGATGGGISIYWSQPAYQNYPYTGYTAGNGGSTTMRNVPDVAAEAAVTTGVAVYVGDQGGWQQVGGTSIASPLWAGYLSDTSALRETVGNPSRAASRRA